MLSFTGYWPAQTDDVTGDVFNACSHIRRDGKNGTFCGNMVKPRNTSIIPSPNPSLNDTVGAPTDFGDDVDACAAPDVSPELVSTPNEDDGSDLESSPSASPGDGDDGPACFPGSARAQMADGEMRRVEEVRVGDMVQAGSGVVSEVFPFTHRVAGRGYAFVEVRTEHGKRVSLTGGHYLYANGELRMARLVRRGDFIALENGTRRFVTGIGRKGGRGLFNPQTLQGDIVVEGVVCSIYTEAVEPRCAHGLLVALRFVFTVFGFDLSYLFP